ncbi:beta-lactamase [Boeremia exigua]|uniref:beta-lactamase n=1 Tax=Boeremia exigua TaxID=749465 RepID=UPI001E8DEF0D|nr:beta-lactamase [Boeremia exigua]KAH6638720.1 beta-lactamase [Boeremia exigua]
MTIVQGHCDQQFSALEELFASKLANGDELGASIVINVNGTNVVDIWGGHADAAHSQPWTRDTITNVWSSTKTIAALAVLIAHDRGLLDVDQPVSKYWPEFAANGKESVLVRHVLSHSSGVSGWETPLLGEQVADLTLTTSLLAQQAPWWEPGTASGYHMVNFGHMLGELIKRVTGLSMKDFVAKEIAGPLNADFQIGALEKDWARVATLIEPPPANIDFSKMDPKGPALKTFSNPLLSVPTVAESWWRKADLPGVNGHTNARGLNTILSAISNGGVVNGKQVLSQKTIDLIWREQTSGPDLVIGLPLRYGIGYGLGGGATAQSLPWLASEDFCFWGGYGGSWEVMDRKRHVTFTYVMNKMGSGILGNERTVEYVELVWKILGEAISTK